jgi:hypoxanthine phosphoribosyltransferase
MNDMRQDVDTILLTEAQIQKRLDELAVELQRDYAEKELTIVAVLTGSVLFVADLLRRLPLQLRLDCIAVSSYHGGTRPNGDFVITKALCLDVRDRDVLVVDDILDTGQTLTRVCDMIRQLQPASLKSCVFLDKEVPRDPQMKADYFAFRVPNKFVVGYGLDYQERYRNLPYLATLRPEAIQSAS